MYGCVTLVDGTLVVPVETPVVTALLGKLLVVVANTSTGDEAEALMVLLSFVGEIVAETVPLLPALLLAALVDTDVVVVSTVVIEVDEALALTTSDGVGAEALYDALADPEGEGNVMLNEPMPCGRTDPPVLFDGAPPYHKPFHTAIEPLTFWMPVTAERYVHWLPSKFRAIQAESESQYVSQSSKLDLAASWRRLISSLISVPWKASPQVTVYTWPALSEQTCSWEAAAQIPVAEQRGYVPLDADEALPGTAVVVDRLGTLVV